MAKEWGTAGATNTDPSVFRDFVEAHKKMVYYLALDLTGNHHDAEDLSQEVFIKAYRSMGDFRGDAKPSSWLHRITVNAYIDSRRRKVIRFLPIFGWKKGGEDTPLPIPDEDARSHPADGAERRQIQEHISRALGRLSPRERAVFVLRHYSDLSLNEIAADLRVSLGTVKVLLFRAVHKLQSELAIYAPQGGRS